MAFICSSVLAPISRSSAYAKTTNFLLPTTTPPLPSHHEFLNIRNIGLRLTNTLVLNLFSSINYRSFFYLPLVRFPSLYIHPVLSLLFLSLHFLKHFYHFFPIYNIYVIYRLHVCKERTYLPILCYFSPYYIIQHIQIINTTSSCSKTCLDKNLLTLISFPFHFLVFFQLPSRKLYITHSLKVISL